MKTKYIIYILVALVFVATFTSCSKDDDDSVTSLTVSQNEVSFTSSGGEQVVSITSDEDWRCSYDADWILVREQQQKIRIIASINPSAESRTTVIHLLCKDKIRSTITVIQNGVLLDVNESAIEIASAGETRFVNLVHESSDFGIECIEDWIEAEERADGIVINVQRNFNMSERVGSVKIHQGNVEKVLSIKQDACQWYESFQMTEVLGGTFNIGAQKDDVSSTNYCVSAYPIEAPVHNVTLDSYYIGTFEVTQAQWVAAMGSNPSTHKGDNLPVENVSWEQVQDFITLLNSKTSLNYRLPTEAEWEFAANGGTLSEGNLYSGFPTVGACGWYYSNSNSSTHEVGTKYPNELGIYDMSGNVREWCDDWFEYYSSSPVTNPKGPTTGTMKVNRGGSWTTPAINCRNSYRHTDFPSETSQDLGFRLALSH